MKQQTVMIAALIGLIFGFLFAGTLGIDFFGSDDTNNNDDIVTESGLKKDEAAFKTAYNLNESIYVPITSDAYQEKLDNDETFILYLGRDTCPYCQQYVPELMVAAENRGLTEIYHIDTIDPLNKTFIDDNGINLTPTTYIVKDGVVVQTVIGFKTTEAMEQILIDTLS